MSLRNRLICLASVLIALLLAPSIRAEKEEWRPVEASQLALKAPLVEKDADAEAIFWEVRVKDEAGDNQLTLLHYIRIKIFTERGRESQSRIDIPYFDRNKIEDIAGRTIKPDGSIVELKKDAVFEKTLVKTGGFKIKAKSFAMPAVEPGAIIEYRWREVRKTGFPYYLRVYLQKDLPIQSVKYFFKIEQRPGYDVRARMFRGPAATFQKEKDGYYTISNTNIPAFREEPLMPPEDEVRFWMLLYCAGDLRNQSNEFWNEFAKNFYEATKEIIKADDDVRKAVSGLTANAASPKEKLDRIFEFCRTKIKRIDDDASGMTEDQISKVKENKKPSDTLKRGMGTGRDVNFLFAAMAAAAGFDSRIALLADRSDSFFDKTFHDDYFLTTFNIAARVGAEWLFFDPASTYVPAGMLQWKEEGIDALICDSKDPRFVRTPMSPPDRSLKKSFGKLRLSEDGTLEGDVRIEYTGHFAAYHKEYNDEDSPEQREQTLRKIVKSRTDNAEVSNIRIENVADPVKPFVYSYHIRVPNYAQRTGKRIFFQPTFFQKGKEQFFSTSDRKFPIYFEHPWAENEVVEIDLPNGYALDGAAVPNPTVAGEICKYEVKAQITQDQKTLIYTRDFFFGGGGSVLFPVNLYSQLKKLFDAIREKDALTITLKQSAGN